MDLVATAPRLDDQGVPPDRLALISWSASLVHDAADRAGVSRELLNVAVDESGAWAVVASVGSVGVVKLHVDVPTRLSTSLDRLDREARQVWRNESTGVGAVVRPWLATLIVVPERLAASAGERANQLVAERTLDVACVLALADTSLDSPTPALSIASLRASVAGRMCTLAAIA